MKFCVGCTRSDPHFDLSKICYHTNVLWWDMRHIQQAENLFLTKIVGASILKIATSDTLVLRHLGAPVNHQLHEVKR